MTSKSARKIGEKCNCLSNQLKRKCNWFVNKLDKKIYTKAHLNINGSFYSTKGIYLMFFYEKELHHPYRETEVYELNPNQVAHTVSECAMIEFKELEIIEECTHSSNAKYFMIFIPFESYYYLIEECYR